MLVTPFQEYSSRGKDRWCIMANCKQDFSVEKYVGTRQRGGGTLGLYHHQETGQISPRNAAHCDSTRTPAIEDIKLRYDDDRK